jgi:hypothetical protein
MRGKTYVSIGTGYLLGSTTAPPETTPSILSTMTSNVWGLFGELDVTVAQSRKLLKLDSEIQPAKALTIAR